MIVSMRYRKTVRAKCPTKSPCSLPQTVNSPPVLLMLVMAANHLIYIILWPIGGAISRVKSNFLPALREAVRAVDRFTRLGNVWSPGSFRGCRDRDREDHARRQSARARRRALRALAQVP